MGLGDYEGMFTKAGDCFMRALSIEEATGEPRLSCFSLLGNQEKRGF